MFFLPDVYIGWKAYEAECAEMEQLLVAAEKTVAHALSDAADAKQRLREQTRQDELEASRIQV